MASTSVVLGAGASVVVGGGGASDVVVVDRTVVGGNASVVVVVARIVVDGADEVELAALTDVEVVPTAEELGEVVLDDRGRGELLAGAGATEGASVAATSVDDTSSGAVVITTIVTSWHSPFSSSPGNAGAYA